MTLYLKITNRDENHHGFQYVDGLNILKEKWFKSVGFECFLVEKTY